MLNLKLYSVLYKNNMIAFVPVFCVVGKQWCIDLIRIALINKIIAHIIF